MEMRQKYYETCSCIFAACSETAHHWLGVGDTTVCNVVLLVSHIQEMKIYYPKNPYFMHEDFNETTC